MTNVTATSNGVSTKPKTLKGMLDDESIKKRFTEILGAKAPGFISSILAVVNGSVNLAAADPQTVIASAAIAATLDLPINSNLGFAHIVPYSQSKQVDGQWVTQQVAQFQMGWKGYVQLAIRTGLYADINATEIYDGQLKAFNPLTGKYEFDFVTPAKSNEVIGYACYFKLLTGYEKTVYWNVGKIAAHGEKYSKSYKNPKGQWKTNFPGMALKTVVKHTLSTWAPLSIEMQKAINVDQAVISDMSGEKFEYADSTDLTNQKTIDTTHTEMESNFKNENREQGSSTDAQASNEAPEKQADSLDTSDL